MTIPSEKPMRECKFCGKHFRNLGFHVANNHPNILNQLEEHSPDVVPKQPDTNQIARPLAQNNPSQAVSSDLNQLIRDKVETIFNIKILQMLTSQPDVSIKEVQTMLNPPQPMGLSEIKQYHDMVYNERERSNVNVDLGGDSNDWIELAKLALPIVGQLLPQKKKELEANKDDEFRGDEKGSVRVLKPIQKEVAGNTIESGSISKESGIISGESEQNDSKLTDFDIGAK